MKHAIQQVFGGPDETLCGLPAESVDGVFGCWNEGVFGEVVEFGKDGGPDVMRPTTGFDCPACIAAVGPRAERGSGYGRWIMVNGQSAEALVGRADRFVFCSPSRSEVHLERREQQDGSVLWAILRGGMAWTRRKEWEFEPMPSSRKAAYLRRARWTFSEAWAECEKIEQRLGFGLSPTEVLARCLDALAASPKWTPEIRETDVAFWTTVDNEIPFSIRVPVDPEEWPPRELREVACMAVAGCGATGVKVDLRARLDRLARTGRA